MKNDIALQASIIQSVTTALAEDIGSGDITAMLIDEKKQYSVKVIAREAATICGAAWVNEAFLQVDPNVAIEWHVSDGDSVASNQTIFIAIGKAQSILTAERTALNFLQLLSGTATTCSHYAQAISNYKTKILDTRKTIPGLRLAQKYAALCGGCVNHRVGLYDAFLIKENHIAACGSIATAITEAKKQQPGKTVEIEVENIEQLHEALDVGADIIMLDNFSLEAMQQAVQLNGGQAKLEASGNMTLDLIPDVAKTGVDYISIGALTKHVQAIDFSMRFIDAEKN